jgi:hypothetical protein
MINVFYVEMNKRCTDRNLVVNIVCGRSTAGNEKRRQQGSKDKSSEICAHNLTSMLENDTHIKYLKQAFWQAKKKAAEMPPQKVG